MRTNTLGAWIVGMAVLAGAQTGRARPSQAASADPIVIRIVAERFSFSPARIEAPSGARIEFHLTSLDTTHGFRILGTEVDVRIPKRGRGERTVTFEPPREGSYRFECSKLCGAGHSFMRGVIEVRDPPGTR